MTKFSPENRMVARIDRNRLQAKPDELVAKAYESAQRMLNKEGYKRINPRDFSNFDPEMIAKDLQSVVARKASFTPEDKMMEQRGAVLEAIVLDQIERNWFPEVSTIRASEYDDYMNGVDVLFVKQAGLDVDTLALSLDATTSQGRLKVKLDKSKQNQGVTNVKYFATEDSSMHASLSGIPYMVVYADNALFLEVTELWMKSNNKEPRAQTALQRHRIQCIIAKQLLIQTDHTLATFPSSRPTTKRILATYKNMLSLQYRAKLEELGLEDSDIEKESSVRALRGYLS
jgi:hypothetical protein